jgi:hypothetical protein
MAADRSIMACETACGACGLCLLTDQVAVLTSALMETERRLRGYSRYTDLLDRTPATALIGHQRVVARLREIGRGEGL